MQFDVTTGNYFGTLMSRLVDESRRLLKEDGKKFDPTPEAYKIQNDMCIACLLYTSPSPRDRTRSRMPSSA